MATLIVIAKQFSCVAIKHLFVLHYADPKGIGGICGQTLPSSGWFNIYILQAFT